MRYYTALDLSDATTVSNRINNSLGYPKVSIKVGGGKHINPLPDTETYGNIIEDRGNVYYRVDDTSEALLTAAESLRVITDSSIKDIPRILNR